MEIYLLRHPPVQIKKGICYGQSDLPIVSNWETYLSPKINTLPENLKVFSSDLKRCSEVAQHLYPNNFITDQNLREVHFGSWEGRKWNDIPKNQIDEWNNKLDTWNQHQGESFQQLKERAQTFIGSLDQTSETPVLIVTHAGWIRALLAHLLNLTAQQAFMFEFNYGSLSCIASKKNYSSIVYLNH